jgi:hypothetical protein
VGSRVLSFCIEFSRLKGPAAIEAFLRRRRRPALHEAITACASGRAGTDYDLDPVLERAAIEHLLDEEEQG